MRAELQQPIVTEAVAAQPAVAQIAPALATVASYKELIALATAKRDVLVRLALEGSMRPLSFEQGRHLYGRHYGAPDALPGLHFELCYHALVERAIARGYTLVEAGAQGEHKLKRGFLPVITHSAHLIFDKGFAKAIGQALVVENGMTHEEQRGYLASSPFKDGSAPPTPLIAGTTP